MTSSRSSKAARAWRKVGQALGLVLVAPVALVAVVAAALASWLWPEPDPDGMTKDEWRWS